MNRTALDLRPYTTLALLATLAIVLNACGLFRIGPPITSVEWNYNNGIRSQTKPRHETLIVFLPGLGNRAHDYRRNGFVRAIRESNVQADMIGLNAHVGYHLSQTLSERIAQDIIKPARAKGYQKIWLVGISLGGYGALTYLRDGTEPIDGVVLLAPFVGDSRIPYEIRDAGGLNAWEPVTGTTLQDQPRNLLYWLSNNLMQISQDIPVYLAFGHKDTYRKSQKILALMLPKERVLLTKGTHDWSTWEKQWNQLIPIVWPTQ